MKILLTGLWVVLVALGAAYGMALYLPSTSETGKAAAAAPAPLQTQKTRVINVPVVTGGALHGFVSAQFVYTQDGNLAKTLQIQPDVYLLDEAFRAIYSDTAFDPDHVERYDLKKLTAGLVKSTNDRLGVPIVKDVLIENFSYIDKDSNRG